MKLPTEVNVLGNLYPITYTDNMMDTDPNGRVQLLGSVDIRERNIRVYSHNRTEFDIIQTLLHEILHCIVEEMKFDLGEDAIDVLATVVLDTLTRNGFVK